MAPTATGRSPACPTELCYSWWQSPREAPDYATHVDIHNKPGFDPCELFWGSPPPRVSLDASKVRGTHGRPDRPAALLTTLPAADLPADTAALGLAASGIWPVAVARLAYWPAVAVPVAVQVIFAPTASVELGQEMAPMTSSVTVTDDSGALPVFVTT